MDGDSKYSVVIKRYVVCKVLVSVRHRLCVEPLIYVEPDCSVVSRSSGKDNGSIVSESKCCLINTVDTNFYIRPINKIKVIFALI